MDFVLIFVVLECLRIIFIVSLWNEYQIRLDLCCSGMPSNQLFIYMENKLSFVLIFVVLECLRI